MSLYLNIVKATNYIYIAAGIHTSTLNEKKKFEYRKRFRIAHAAQYNCYLLFLDLKIRNSSF